MSTQTETETAQRDSELIERITLKAFVEACLILEESIAGIRDIDLGMMMGTGTIPGPFARADQRGLDDVLAALEKAQSEWDDYFEPPAILRRMVNQGRLGVKSGQGFYAYPQPEEGFEHATVKLDTRGDVAIAWIDNPPANSLSPAVIGDFGKLWHAIKDDPKIHALILASPNPALFCAGADIKAFQASESNGGGSASQEFLADPQSMVREMERSRIVTIAAVNGLALGGGCEIVMSCDVRIASISATFGQPEINLGIMPGLGGTQRLPRLVGPAKALEMNLTGETISAEDAYNHGLVNQVVTDHELFDTAMLWARKFASQAPIAIEKIKRVSYHPDLDTGLADEQKAFGEIFGTDDAKEGIAAFIGKRNPKWSGR